jgi:hypothetical protein
MNATLGMWEQVASPEERVKEEAAVEATQQTVAEQFGNEQILGLIRGLFFAGPRQARQVVFSGVGEDARSSEVCNRVAEALASQTKARVCLLNTDRRPSTVEDEFGGGSCGRRRHSGSRRGGAGVPPPAKTKSVACAICGVAEGAGRGDIAVDPEAVGGVARRF